MVCLDSDILIAFLKGDAAAVAKVAKLREGEEGPLRTTMVNAYELMRGANLSRVKKEMIETKVGMLISELEVLGIDLQSCNSSSSVFR